MSTCTQLEGVSSWGFKLGAPGLVGWSMCSVPQQGEVVDANSGTAVLRGGVGSGAQYTAVLPTRTGSLLEWTPKELQMLTGSPTAAAAVEVRPLSLLHLLPPRSPPPRHPSTHVPVFVWLGRQGAPHAHTDGSNGRVRERRVDAGRAAQLRAEVEAAAEAVAAVTPFTPTEMKAAFSVLFSRCDALSVCVLPGWLNAEEVEEGLQRRCCWAEFEPSCCTKKCFMDVRTCWCRLVRLPGRGDMLALLPYADLLNHQPGVEAYLDYEGQGDSGAVVLRVDRAYSAGEQVFISYGEKSSGELLLQYGFVPPPAAAATTASNPHEAVPLTLTLSPGGDDPLYDVKTAALQRWHVTSPQLTFPVRMAGMPAALLPTAAFVALGGDDCTAEQVDAVAAVAFGGAC